MTNNKKRFQKLTSQFSKKHILVVGDIMLDEYIIGNITRMSPESPTTPVILIKEKKYMLGGAANVAANLLSLGARVTLAGIIGNDTNGLTVQSLVKKSHMQDCLVIIPDRPTTTKTRVYENSNQLTRIDSEITDPLPSRYEKQLLKNIKEHTQKSDLVIVSDYAKGAISASIVSHLKKIFGAHNIICDFKPKNKSAVIGTYAITPNLKESSELSGIKITDISSAEKAVRIISQALQTSAIVTLGDKGAVGYCTETKEIKYIPAKKVKTRDVTGAGDTFTAAFALARACDVQFFEGIAFANYVAAIAVSRPHTTSVTTRDIIS